MDERHKELLVLRVCLGEIVRSRPFLIGLIGDRYGWIPPEARMQAAVAEQDFATDVRGKSVTALEIEFGVLDSADQKRRSHFYFRQPLPYDAMPVLEHLWSDLDDETRPFARAPIPSWQEQERWSLEEFVENRGRGFIGRVETTQELLDHATSPAEEVLYWGACVTGVSGSGKSALFANLYRELSGRPDILLLAHAAGISLRAGQVHALLRRWTGELAAALGIDDPLADDSTNEQVEAAFGQLLSRAAAGRRVVMLIDAVNQFDPSPRARYLTWLPKLFPCNGRLIVTAIPGPESAALLRREGTREVPLPRLDLNEARQIVHAVCGRYHRQIHSDIVQALLDKRMPDDTPSAGIPLWLELAVEELNLLDADDFARAERDYRGAADEKLHQMMLDVARRDLPAGVEELYGYLLERAEQLAGWNWAMAFAVLLAVSRHGLREADLESLLPELTGEPWDGLRFATLRRAFRAHVVQRGRHGQWDFFHAQMRAAIARQYLDGAVSREATHTAVADHLEGLPPGDPLRTSELMYHLIGSDDRPRAARHYAGLAVGDERAAATRTLAGHVVQGMAEPENPGLRWIVSLLRQTEFEPTERGGLCERYQFDLKDVLENDANLDTRRSAVEAVRECLEDLAAGFPVADPGNALWQRDVWVSCWRLATVAEQQGDGQARQWWQRAYEVLQGMQQRGVFVSAQDQQFMEQIRGKLGK